MTEEMHVLVLSFMPRHRGLVFGIVPVRFRDFTRAAPTDSLNGDDADEFIEWFTARGIEIRSGNSTILLGPDELFEFRMRWA
ncbi:hypothetical protein ASF08_10870 [Methylobacterium sp. Leaf85]|nr:hypothetical protein ASF08_10870 [Methylobacterium sp. Leaf85]